MFCLLTQAEAGRAEHEEQDWAVHPELFSPTGRGLLKRGLSWTCYRAMLAYILYAEGKLASCTVGFDLGIPPLVEFSGTSTVSRLQ